MYPTYCCSHYTNIVSNMIQVIYLYIEVNLLKKLLITKCFLGGGSIQFSFAYIPGRINHLIVGRINFDICNIRYYELYVYVISYFKETSQKNKLYEGCSNMNASSFITFFTYMLRQNVIPFWKELFLNLSNGTKHKETHTIFLELQTLI